MDQLWKELKDDLAANRQFKNIAEAVDYAEQWVLHLTTRHYEKPAYFQRAIGSDSFEKIFGHLLSMSNRAKGNQVKKGWKK